MTGFVELSRNGYIHLGQIVPFMVLEEAGVVHKPITHVRFKFVARAPSSASVRGHSKSIALSVLLDAHPRLDRRTGVSRVPTSHFQQISVYLCVVK